MHNPNKVYSLIGGFCGSPVNFHAKDGSGYKFLGEAVVQLDKINPQVASRMVSAFSRWKRYDATRQALAKVMVALALSLVSGLSTSLGAVFVILSDAPNLKMLGLLQVASRMVSAFSRWKQYDLLSMKRSLSDGNILGESNTTVSETDVWMKKPSNLIVPERLPEDSQGLSECTSCETNISNSRYTPPQIYFDEDALNCSNFVDFDWLSSAGNSCEDELHERSSIINSSFTGMSSENVMPEIVVETAPPTRESGSSISGRVSTEAGEFYRSGGDPRVCDGFSDSFACWVDFGEALCKVDPRMLEISS